MDWTNDKEKIETLTPVEKENIKNEALEVSSSANEPFLNPEQLAKLADLFQKEILPAMKEYEKEVERNPELKAHFDKQAKVHEVHRVFRDMMTEVEIAIEKPGTPFADKLKTYIDELEDIVNPISKNDEGCEKHE